jgi:secreted trypsin-like serine protease
LAQGGTGEQAFVESLPGGGKDNEEKGETPMKKLWISLGLVLILVMVAVPVGAITWGQPDTKHTNVGAMVVDWPGYGPWQVCSGTLINPRVFLTAGHCTDGWEGTGVETFWVNFDQDALNADTLLEVEEVITHPEYWWGPTSNPHDVGILILAAPVSGITPATLPDEGFLDRLREEGKLKHGKDKAKFTVVGYGGTLHWPPPEITYEDERQFAVSEHRALLKAWLRMSQNQATGDGGTCGGDSGGPAFWTEPDGSEILVGITSWGDPNCISTGFNYRVDIPDTLDFIGDVLANLD